MSELDQQLANRRAKRESLRARGIAAYPHRYPATAQPHDLVTRFAQATAEELAAQPLSVRVPGRLLALRGQGKLTFIDLHDGQGKIQLFVRRDRLDPDSQE